MSTVNRIGRHPSPHLQQKAPEPLGRGLAKVLQTEFQPCDWTHWLGLLGACMLHCYIGKVSNIACMLGPPFIYCGLIFQIYFLCMIKKCKNIFKKKVIDGYDSGLQHKSCYDSVGTFTCLQS